MNLSDFPCFIMAEVAQSHDGSLGTAHAYIDAIAKAGADAVKFQTHIATAESTPSEPWRVRFSLQDKKRYDYWRRMEFSEEQWRSIKEHAEKMRKSFNANVINVLSLREAKRRSNPEQKEDCHALRARNGL